MKNWKETSLKTLLNRIFAFGIPETWKQQI